MLKEIFSLTLRATQGLLDSLFELMNVPLCAPDYICVCKSARTVKVSYRQPAKRRITDLVIDSTGLKVFGDGEWKVRKHGAEKRRVWRKLHQASHQLISRKGATACIPPRKSAGLWKKGHPRNEAVLVMRKEGLAHRKKISGYHRRSQAETAMYRFKQLLAGKISLRNYNGQVGEVMAYVMP